MVRVLVLAVVMCMSCRRGDSPSGTAAGAPLAAPAAVPDAGFVLTAAMLDAYLAYHAGTVGPVDGGVLGRARRDEAVRARSGLSDDDIAQIDGMVSAVIARRMVTQLSEHNALMPDLSALGQNLSDEQKKRMEQAVVAFRGAQKAAADLKDERARFGSANVDMLLTREPELLKSWEALMTNMAVPKAP